MQFLPMADKVSTDEKHSPSNTLWQIVELSQETSDQHAAEVCCGGPPPPKSNPFEQAGYELSHYVRAFTRTNEGFVPLVETKLDRIDHFGTLRARLGVGRDSYKVAPGLYGVGCPDCDSPVVVTANYKLSFDKVREGLDSLDCWILVLDTCGINVWCAAGKNTFSTNEIVNRIEVTQLASRVNHRRLIVPQLGATGVAAHQVKLKCGFRVVYGPVRASDLQDFLSNDLEITTEMRAVTFTFRERFELIPVEFYLFSKKIWWIFPLIFLLSGFGSSFFSFTQAWQRGLLYSAGFILGGILGAMLVPLFLPWIPGRSFALKGSIVGVCGGTLLMFGCLKAGIVDNFCIVFIISAVSSYLAMNFTGSTPYTSPSGVEKEMKIAIPLQAGVFLLGSVMWLISPFL